MKKIILAFAIFSFMLNSCSGDDDNNNNNNNGPAPVVCSSVTSLSVSQDIDEFTFNIVATGSPAYYEVVYSQNTNTNPENSDGSVTLENGTNTAVMNQIYPGLKKFWARGICTDGTKGAWSTPFVLNVTEFCQRPLDLYFDGSYLSWNGSSIATYEIEYGPEGFTPGNGTTMTSTTTSADGFALAAQTSYDFYVRGNCSGGSIWSAWAGPYNYFNENTQNMCQQPTNLYFITTYYNGVPDGAEFHYDANGQTEFQYALMPGNQQPTGSSIEYMPFAGSPEYSNMSPSQTYTFYIRAVCSNGTYTPWSTLLVNI